MTATFIIAKIKIYASAMPGSTELRRCNIEGGHSFDFEHLFRVDGLHAFHRIFNIPPVLLLDHEYEVIVRFANPSLVMPHLSVGKRFDLEALNDIGMGTVVEIHDYGDLLTAWGPGDCPWNGDCVRRPDYYLETELMGDIKMPVACFVLRKKVFSDCVVNEVHIDPTLSEERARELGLPRGELTVKMAKYGMIDGGVTVLPSFPDDNKLERVEGIATGRIYTCWDAWRNVETA
jgi:hypothetical protein